MKILSKFVKNLPLLLAGLALATIISLETAQALSRYLLGHTFLFVDDIAVICFSWVIFAGSAAAYRAKMHYGLDVLTNALHGKTKTVFMLCVQVLTALVFAYFLYYSIELYRNVGPKILTTTGLSYRWVDGALVYGFAMMLIYCIKFLVQDIIKLKSPAAAGNEEQEAHE